MKHLFLISAAVAGAFCGSAQMPGDDVMTYLECGFETGFPEGTATFDRDGQELHFTMVQWGFEKYASWMCLREEGKENYFAASASRFKKDGNETPAPASDWMVLPIVWLRGGNATLQWDARSINEQSSHSSTYSIYVSTAGQDPASFGEPLASFTEPADGDWQHRSVDLSAFNGQKVYVAFVNESDDGEILAVDNISLSGGKGLAELVVTPGEYVLGLDRSFSIGGTLTAYSDVPVESLHVECDVMGRTLEADYDSLGLRYGESFSFTFPEEIQVDFGDSVDFTVRAVVNSTVYEPIECSTTVLAFLPSRRVVIEEATGMWCQFCPKGIVAFDVLQEKYPESFIGIAVHMMKEMDPLALDDYANAETFPQGAPSGWIDRKWYSADPMVLVWEDNRHVYTTMMGGFETLFLQRMNEQPLAEVYVNATVADGQLDVTADSRFPINIDNADLRLAIALTEDHVWQEGYFQYNRFSGGNEILGGYEDMPAVISEDYEFNHVARAIFDSRSGIPSSLPATVKAGETYPFSASYPLPESILNPDNLNVIAMIIDNSNGEIMNATSVRPVTDGVDHIESSDLLNITRRGEVLAIDILDVVNATEATVYDLSGNVVRKASARGAFTVDIKGLQGVYVIDVRSGNEAKRQKMVL